MGGTAAAAAQLGIEPTATPDVGGEQQKRARTEGPTVVGSFAQVCDLFYGVWT